MKQALVPMLAMTMLASCASNGVAESAAMGALTRSFELTAGLGCEPSLGLWGCLRRNEASAAKEHRVKLSRARGPLCLSGPGTGDVCLPHREGLDYVFFERTEGYFVLVESWQTEGYTVLLVDEDTGRKSRVDNRPLFSPAQAFFATVAYDTDAGYGPNRVAIWDASTSELLYAVDRFAPGTGPTRIRWRDSTRLQVFYSRSQYSAGPDADTDSFSVWRDAKGAWHDDYRG